MARAKTKPALGEPEDPAQLVLASATQQFGAGSLLQMGDQPVVPVEVIPSGSIGLDVKLGIGGLPRGRVIEIYGPEGSGKTTLALHAIANAQKAGGLAVFIDAEHALDLVYAANLGVDVDHLLLNQPDCGEQGLEMADMCIRSKLVDIVVIDSVAALTPRAEIAGEMGDSFPGMQARLMSQALRKLTAAIGQTKTTCIFINQLREKIGVIYGSPETTSGGKALKFYASVRLDCRKSELIKDGPANIGHKLRIKIVKNKLAPPFREYIADLIYGKGISRESELIDLGVEYGVVQRTGAFYSFGDGQAVQGKDKARRHLEENRELSDQLELALRARMLVMAPPPTITAKAVASPADLLGVGAPPLADIAVPDQPGDNDPDTQ